MRVPVRQRVVHAAAPVDRHQPHARLDQPAGQQQTLTVLVPSVALAQAIRLGAEVERAARRLRGQQRRTPVAGSAPGRRSGGRRPAGPGRRPPHAVAPAGSPCGRRRPPRAGRPRRSRRCWGRRGRQTARGRRRGSRRPGPDRCRGRRRPRRAAKRPSAPSPWPVPRTTDWAPRWGKSLSVGVKAICSCGGGLPVVTKYVAALWLTAECVIDRTMRKRCACRARSGRCSVMRMPGTFVAVGRNSPRTSAGASGFMSQMSS